MIYGAGGVNSYWFHVLEFPRVERAATRQHTQSAHRRTEDEVLVLPGTNDLYAGYLAAPEASRRRRSMITSLISGWIFENGAVLAVVHYRNHFKESVAMRCADAHRGAGSTISHLHAPTS